MKLTEIVARDAVVVPLKSSDRDGVIGELLSALLRSGAAPEVAQSELLTKVLERERHGSTGFGKGVAVPHVKHRRVGKMAAAIGVSTRGVDFTALDRQPVYSVFLLLSPEDQPEDHLRAMEVIFKSLSKESFRRALRGAQAAADVHKLLEEADGNTLPG